MGSRLTPVRAIRLKCLDCSANQIKEVKECPVSECALYLFRMGKNPNRAGKGGVKREGFENLLGE